MNRCVSQRAIGFALLVVFGVTSFTAPALAAARPHFSSGTAQFISASDFVGEGSATHLGKYQEEGSAQFTPTENPAVFEVDASTTYTAANGDQLDAVIAGEIDFSTGRITATVTYVGGTGRFANASGTAHFVGQMHPNGSVDADVVGTINFGGH
jgi:hypothetical protein